MFPEIVILIPVICKLKYESESLETWLIHMTLVCRPRVSGKSQVGLENLHFSVFRDCCCVWFGDHILRTPFSGLKEPHMAILALIGLLNTKEMLYLLEICFSIQVDQPRLLLEQFMFRTLHTAQGEFCSGGRVMRGHKKASGDCYFRSEHLNLFVVYVL